MSTWSNITVTNKGYALQAKLLSTDALTITRVVSGSGKVVAGQLVNQTGVTDIVQTLSVRSLYYDDKGNAVLLIGLNNTGLTETYICNQIGVYATDPDEGEILYLIAQADVGEEIPSIEKQPYGYDHDFKLFLTYSNSQNVSVTIDPANALTQESGDMRYLKQADANIRKNSEEETGDIVDGHFTVGTRRPSQEYGENSFSSGSENVASGTYSFIGGGYNNDAYGDYGFTGGGRMNSADGYCAAVIGGGSSDAEGEYSLAGGIFNTARERQTVFGKYADTSSSLTKRGVESDEATVGSLFAIGNGTGYSSLSNAFRVSASGAIYAGQSSNATGADYAEYMEWEDGNPNNEDRRGRMVTFALTEPTCTVEEITILHPVTRLPVQVKAITSNKLPPVRFAKAGDNVIGVVSGSGAFIGNAASEIWDNQYLKDVYGERIQQAVFVPEETKIITNPKTGEVIGEKVIPEHYETRFVLNPLYDSKQKYISREERPEWSPIGLLGVVTVEDDGTCVVGGFCGVSAEGIGTSAESGYRVLQRIDNTHIKVFVK